MALVFPSDNASPNDAPPIAFQGQIADAGLRYCYSAWAEGTGVKAGVPCKRGTAPETQVSAITTGDTITVGNFAGIPVLSSSRPYDATLISAGDDVSVMRLGVVYLEFGEAVTAGEQVTIVLATGVLGGVAQGTAAGAIATGTVVLPGLRIVQTTSAAGPARVEVNLFGSQDAATVGSL